MDRQPAVAGAFYPADAHSLHDLLGDLIPQQDAKAVIAAMLPHAGYIYSGKVAGVVAANVLVPDNVIVICPNHSGMGARCALWQDGSWQFPGFSVPVATDLADELLVATDLLEADYAAHTHEHSLEVVIPFLHYRNPNIRIVPICVSSISQQDITTMGETLARLIKKHPDTLLVASSDMSHFISAQDAHRLDHLALEPLLELETEKFVHTVKSNRISMCGVTPAAIVSTAVALLGGSRGTLLAYDHSGSITGDDSEVVGYAGVVFD